MIISVAIILFVLAAAAALDTRLTVRRYTDYSDKMKKGIRVAALTDLHCTEFGAGQEALLQKLEEERPDIVFLVGDIVDRKRPMASAELLMQRLSAKYPCFFVQGNHEYGRPEAEPAVRSCGIPILDGEGRVVELDGRSIFVAGLPDIWNGEALWRSKLAACEAQRREECYSVLLSHRPSLTEDYAQCGFDLILCGHTHGGQVRIPFLLNGLFCPDEYWFPKYAGGAYEVGSSKMIVSRGLAVNRLPRIFNPPEIVIVDILPAAEQRASDGSRPK